MNKFRGGQKLQPTMTKQQVLDLYTQKVQELSNSVQQFQTWNMKQLSSLMQQIMNMSARLEAIDYRTVATRNLLIAKGVFTDEEHANEAKKLRIEDFDKESAIDDIKRKLMPVSDDHEAKLGDIMTAEIEATYASTFKTADGTEVATDPAKAGLPISQLSTLRTKVSLGSGELMPDLEVKLLGAKKGDKRVVELAMPTAYQAFAGEAVKFEVNVIDLKVPLKMEAPIAAEETPQSNVDANAHN